MKTYNSESDSIFNSLFSFPLRADLGLRQYTKVWIKNVGCESFALFYGSGETLNVFLVVGISSINIDKYRYFWISKVSIRKQK